MLWPIPKNLQAAEFLGHLFSLGLIATAIYAATRRVRPSERRWLPAAALGSAMCGLLVLWALQPAIWQSAFGGPADADLPDFDPYVATRFGNIAIAGPASAVVSYPEPLLIASRQASVEPASGVRIFVHDLYNRGGATKALPIALWPDAALSIPGWDVARTSISSLWVQVLLGSTDWLANSPPRTSDLAAFANGVKLPAVRAVLVASQPHLVGWALVDFTVPTSLIGADGRLEFRPSPSSLEWNGSPAGPWLRVLPESGVIPALANGQAIDAGYEVDSTGQGYLLGMPLVSPYALDLPNAGVPGFRIEGAVLRWPNTPEPWRSNLWLRVIGALYGLTIIVAAAMVLSRTFRGEVATP
jgi:hypothetical protein